MGVVCGPMGKVKLHVDLYKPLEQRFQIKGKKWDDSQDRAFTDSTKECGACVDPFKYVVPTETKQTIANLIANEKLRFPHDLPSPSYAGYRTRLSRGVGLSKVELPTVHPFLSTSQATTTRYAEDLKK
ncbi:hypothetical protein NQ314_016178 [Rhamnusium bicolor]|uniref:Uncharacterized protein n=1 Tax=Rhamnusium bicolor TaxID=1586634 RepID=A0AAV8WWX1_9CUCU|nr:hypothetical protein NQ314_016178 [Rhamnusium bicolor]